MIIFFTLFDEIKQIRIQPISPDEPKPGQTPVPPYTDQFEFNIIRGIFKYMDSFPTYKKDDDNSWDLTVNDIFDKGINENYCGQYGKVFFTLARANGIPTKYNPAYFTSWADEQKRNGCWDRTTVGHVYAQVFVNNKWYGIDPTRRLFVNIDDNKVINNRGEVQAIIYAEGRDHDDVSDDPDSRRFLG